MIAPFAAALCVYSLAIWLFPSPSVTVLAGFVVVVGLGGLARPLHPLVLPGFVALAAVTLPLILILPRLAPSFTAFAWLFAVLFGGLLIALRIATSARAAWPIGTMTAVLILLLESRYYVEPGYTVLPQRSIALLTAGITVTTLAATELALLLRQLLRRRRRIAAGGGLGRRNG